ncbi:SDR family oxidoreductase [Salipaludibacillus daqingensis]|uniref:SDR family oxidoreductase n=1 Tax=Salipaludibacillus daqingensis TaxID=3041001 RepID=UPI0024741082|nr:SDR family oxidoreductase [Salipaludibacillus daqingensis]
MIKKQTIALVTGANSGMGKATAFALANQDSQVIMLCRNEVKGKQAQEEIVNKTGNTKVDLLLCDFADLTDVRRFASHFNKTYGQLNVLVNNAAIISTKRQESKQGYELQFAVNHLAPFLLTNLLMDKLIGGAPARIVNVSSGAYKFGRLHFDDLQSEKKYRTFKAYAQTKLANILFTYELSRRFQERHVTANCLHPGAVSTNLGIDRDTGFGKTIVKLLKPFFKTPEEGSQTAVYLATSAEIEDVTGKYFENKKEVKTKDITHNEKLSSRLWSVSEELVGL